MIKKQRRQFSAVLTIQAKAATDILCSASFVINIINIDFVQSTSLSDHDTISVAFGGTFHGKFRELQEDKESRRKKFCQLLKFAEIRPAQRLSDSQSTKFCQMFWPQNHLSALFQEVFITVRTVIPRHFLQSFVELTEIRVENAK